MAAVAVIWIVLSLCVLQVRQNLLNKQKRIEAAEKMKKLREMRKYGKKVSLGHYW